VDGMSNKVFLRDSLEILSTIPENSIDLIYIDPPFNTGKVQNRKNIKTVRGADGYEGFGGNFYNRETISEIGYDDNIQDYFEFLYSRIKHCYRILKSTGSIFLHLNWHESVTGRLVLDEVFGEDNFRNEIIWAWDYGAKSKKYFPRKHDNIFWYSKSEDYYFDISECDRIEYMAPDLVGEEKAKYGKLPTDVWWMSIVGTNSKEKTGYPNQKPVKLLERIIRTATKPGDTVLDFFAGSGTTGQACLNLGRNFILIDSNQIAIDIMKNRFEDRAEFE
jgi:site-specific DNA-methyltransferase (adenine-specific)